jgi:HK97 family phage major capsid protein
VAGSVVPPDEEGLEERPYGTRPYGTRPYGTRPYGTRPYGTRPYGTRPYGTRPYGTRPYGTRPYGTRPDAAEPDPLDPGVWSQEITELFMQRSSLLRLGASLVASDGYVLIPTASNVATPPGYLDTTTQGGVEKGREKPLARVSKERVWPDKSELAWQVAIPDNLFESIARYPEIAWRLKEDIARGLALVADRALLTGDGTQQRPKGIKARIGPPVTVAAKGLDQLLFAMLAKCRNARQDVYELAGWILHPTTFDKISRLFQGQETSGGATRLLENDGTGGGRLLGFPFVLSSATGDDDGNDRRIFFSSDWGEAWLITYPEVVRVDISFETGFQQDETVIRAVLWHDFTLRRRDVFAYAPEPV